MAGFSWTPMVGLYQPLVAIALVSPTVVNPDLLDITSAFGLGVAAGLNASLPLLVIGVLSRAGLVTLAVPFSALGSDAAIAGFVVLAIIEFFGDKIPGFDAVGHAVLLPLSIAAGGILFAAQSGVVQAIDPGLAIVIGLLVGGTTSGVVHSTRAFLRPAVHTVPFLGPVVSLVEDAMAALLALSAVFAPTLVPVLLVVLLIVAVLLIRLILRFLRPLFRRLFGSRDV